VTSSNRDGAAEVPAHRKKVEGQKSLPANGGGMARVQGVPPADGAREEKESMDQKKNEEEPDSQTVLAGRGRGGNGGSNLPLRTR